MADVFVSYKAEDRRRVRPLVEALEADGFTVWWDARIGGGSTWRQAIEAELDAAKCVIVVWSKRSAAPEGSFVRDEASRAMERDVYLPVKLDKVRPPLGFGETQALPLIGWRGNRSSPHYQLIPAAVRAIIAGEQPAPTRRRTGSSVDRRTLIAGSGAALVIAGAGGWFLLRPKDSEVSDSIAVMPFANLSGDPGQAYFADGMAEELRTALARLPGIRVIGRISSEMFRDSNDVGAVAHKLRVANIVTGSVRRSPSNVRVSAQLVDAESGIERWSQSYDRAPGDVLQIQADIAQRVADALRIRLASAAKLRLFAGGTRNAQAYELFLKALAVRESNHSAENFRQAIEMFSAATRLDPGFANAYAQEASTVADLTGSYANDAAEYETGYNRAADLAQRAIDLAPQLAMGHAALGDVFLGQLKIPQALGEYRQGIARFAGEVEVLVAYASAAGSLGFASEALAAAKRAIPIDPLNPRPRSVLTFVLFSARQYETAIAVIPSVLKLSPKRPPTLALLGNCLTLTNKPDQARAAYAQLPDDDLFRLTGEAILEARYGDRPRADERLDRIRRLYSDAAAYQQAEVLAQIEPDRAFAALDESLRLRDPGLIALLTDPFLDPLRGDPRFGALRRRLNFPSVRV